MNSPAVETAQALFMMLLLVFLVGSLLTKIAEKIQIPDVVLYLIVGMIFGHSGLGFIHIGTNTTLNQVILLFGASFILFHGGTITSFGVLKSVWGTITLLSTLGVVVTACVVGVGVAAHWILGLPFAIALLLGALLASTDPAALVPIFQRLPIRQKVAQTVISESAFTDATGAILTTLVFTAITAHSAFSIGSTALGFIRLAFGGILMGAVVGLVATFLISEHDKAMFREYAPMIVVIAVLASYTIAEWLGASGFMSAFVAGLMIGNSKTFRLPIRRAEQEAIHSFMDAISLKLRMLIFVLLGSQINFAVLLKYIGPAILVIVVFMVIARPLTVLTSLLPDRQARWKGTEILFFFWVRETGVIAVALVGMLASTSIPYSDVLASVTFVAILMTLVIQASTTPAVARILKLLSAK
ncbi:cation:proton antiporter [Alicyclobacillus fastidiosus]|uniref:Cation:proton antiporter n=1 Tax=Alicyclobacillus fastidiosus TaxID=392011 RepID=A0ABV5AAG6_9BACL